MKLTVPEIIDIIEAIKLDYEDVTMELDAEGTAPTEDAFDALFITDALDAVLDILETRLPQDLIAGVCPICGEYHIDLKNYGAKFYCSACGSLLRKEPEDVPGTMDIADQPAYPNNPYHR